MTNFLIFGKGWGSADGPPRRRRTSRAHHLLRDLENLPPTPPFGEAVAIGLLQEMSHGFDEDDGFFELTKFAGQRIRIFDGNVVPVVE